MKSKNIAALVRLSELRFEHDRQQLSQLVQRRNDLMETYNRLEESRVQTSRELVEPIIRQQELAWGRWITKTQTGVNMELFTVKAKEEMLLDRVRGSFGKYNAIQALEIQLNPKIRNV